MEYYAAIKNDEFVSFVGTWMNLETIILSKLTREQKIKHHLFSLIARIIGTRHYTWLIFVFLVETGFHHVGQAILKFLTSGDPPSSASQSAGVTGVSEWTSNLLIPNAEI
ncbi:hypothetical protein AAY473_038743 [Plecturocebus cupreus]